jgi:hypothetical protein
VGELELRVEAARWFALCESCIGCGKLRPPSWTGEDGCWEFRHLRQPVNSDLVFESACVVCPACVKKSTDMDRALTEAVARLLKREKT